VFSLNIPRVSSVKTQPIYCQSGELFRLIRPDDDSLSRNMSPL